MAGDQRGPAIRALDESPNPRSYWSFTDDEDGSEWLVEAVDDAGERWVVKQLAIESNGTEHRYSWKRLEDGWGGLADQPLPTNEPKLVALVDAEFRRRWRGKRPRGSSRRVTP